MALLEQIVLRCTKIEEQLRSLGSEGSGLAELADNARNKISQEVVRKIRRLGIIRNKFVHEHGYIYQGSETQLLSEADNLLEQLQQIVNGNARDASQIIGTHSGLSSKKRKDPSMTHTTPWVQIFFVKDNPKIKIFRHPSTTTRRLVVFESGRPICRELGKHMIPIIGVDAIAYVNFDPWIISFCPLVGTKDHIPLETDVKLTIQVRDNASSIERVANDVYKRTGEEEKHLQTILLLALQSLTSRMEFDALPELDEFARLLRAAFENIDQRKLSFEVTSIDILELRASHEGISSHSIQKKLRTLELDLQKKNAELDAWHLEMQANQERIRLESVRSNKEWEAKFSRDQENWQEDRQEREKSADHQRELNQIRLKTESELQLGLQKLELRKEELSAEVKIAKLKAKAAVAMAQKQFNKEFMGHVIEGAVVRGDYGRLSAFFDQQQSVFFGGTQRNITSQEELTPSDLDEIDKLFEDDGQEDVDNGK